MSQANGRIGLVDMLTAGAGGPKGVDAQIVTVNFDLFQFVGLRQHGHGAGRGMDPTLAFRLRDPLNPMRTGFKLQL